MLKFSDGNGCRNNELTGNNSTFFSKKVELIKNVKFILTTFKLY